MIGTLLQADIFAHLLAYWSAACLSLYILAIVLKLLHVEFFRVRYLWLHVSYVVSRFLYGLLLSVGQYVHWRANPFTLPLTTLSLPLDVPLPGILKIFGPLFAMRHGYFIDYMFSHYWLGFIWGLSCAFLFYVLLRMVRRARPHMLSSLDLHLFIAGSIILPWPNILIYILIVFGIFVLHTVFNTLRGTLRTPLYPSIVIGFLLAFFFSERIVELFPLFEVLKFTRN